MSNIKIMQINIDYISIFLTESIYDLQRNNYDNEGIRIYIPKQVITYLSSPVANLYLSEKLLFQNIRVLENYEMSIVVCHVDMPIRGIEPQKLMLK